MVEHKLTLRYYRTVQYSIGLKKREYTLNCERQNDNLTIKYKGSYVLMFKNGNIYTRIRGHMSQWQGIKQAIQHLIICENSYNQVI